MRLPRSPLDQVCGTGGNTVFSEWPFSDASDSGIRRHPRPQGYGVNRHDQGAWSQLGTAPGAGSTLSLMTLTLMALGLAARRFQRAAG